MEYQLFGWTIFSMISGANDFIMGRHTKPLLKPPIYTPPLDDDIRLKQRMESNTTVEFSVQFIEKLEKVKRKFVKSRGSSKGRR